VRRAGAALAVAAALALGGAERGGCKPDREAPVEVVRSSQTCGGEGEGFSARRIASADELRTALPLTATIGGPERSAEAAAPDFERDAVLLLSMGQRRTGGYALELARPVALVKGDVAGVQVLLREPPAGAVTAQVLTSPCLVVKLPREGLREVKIAGEDGKVLASIPL
jgi:hypothetical protein